MLKKCKNCNNTFEYTKEFFFADKYTKSGLANICKNCKKTKIKQWLKDNPLKAKEYDKQRYLRSLEKDSEYNKKRYLKEKEKHPVVYKKRKTSYEKRLLILLTGCKNRALKRGFDFDLDIEFLINLWEKQEGKCLLTNIPIDLNCKGRYFSPSIDRINSKLGYTKDNVRLVIYGINSGLGEWGDEIFKEICINYIKTQKLILC